MNKKIIGSVLIIIILLLVLTLGFVYMNRKNGQENSMQDDFHEDMAAVISYEGTFKTKGVVVRPEKDNLTIMPISMPISSKEEYRNVEFFYYETENKLNLKQKQEVLVTFHYRKNGNAIDGYEPVADNIEILKDESSVEIPRDIFVKAYSSKDNISISINNSKSNNRQIEFKITDKNELKYDYSRMKYSIQKYNPPPTKTEVIYTEDGGMAIPSYDPWPELKKIKDLPNEFNYTLDEKGQAYIDINWEEVYGELGEGEYKFMLSTVLEPRTSILDEHIIDYPNDGVVITITFNIDSNGKATFNDNEINVTS